METTHNTPLTESIKKCSICGKRIEKHPLSGWTYGNNAEPINSGRCCDSCDATVVIPARVAAILSRREAKND